MLEGSCRTRPGKDADSTYYAHYDGCRVVSEAGCDWQWGVSAAPGFAGGEDRLAANPINKRARYFMTKLSLRVVASIAFGIFICALLVTGMGAISARVAGTQSNPISVTTKPFLTLESQDQVSRLGRYLVSYSLQKGTASYWTWDALKPRPSTVDFGIKPLYGRLTSDLSCLLYREAGQPTIVLKRIMPSETIKSWAIEKEWYCDALYGELTGRFTTVVLADELTVTNHFENEQARLGFFDARTAEMTWVYTLDGGSVGQSEIRCAIPANQGGLIAVGGWQNRGLMVDVSTKKLLWTISLPDTNFYDVAFSPDDKTLYVPGSSESVMIAIDSISGKVRSRWPADSDYGRFVSVAASSNDKWVAAGAGPGGDVCVWAVDTGQVILHVKHAEKATVYSVAFSPDSSLLATSGTHGNIQIWSMPQ
jgi:WD40 repeat protein